MKRILVMGCAGFIGSNFVDYMLINHPDVLVVGYDNFSTGSKANIRMARYNPQFRFLEKDLNKFMPHHSEVKRYDAIFHFAALPRIQPSFIDVSEHNANNVTIALKIIEAIIKQEAWDTKFIYSGSSAIYGNPTVFPTDENQPANPLSPYAFQKYEVEVYLKLLAERYPKLKYTVLRYFNPFGPRSYSPANKFAAYSSVVGIFEYRKSKGLPLQITGDGEQRRDFVHVYDVARANFLAAELSTQNQTYNVGTGKTYSINEIANLISPGVEPEYIEKRAGEADITWSDNSKIIRELGMTFRSFEEYCANNK